MDYTWMVGAAGAIGGSVLTIAANWVNRTWQLKDKKREQAEARAEASRKELSSAYASFLMSLSKFVSSCGRVAAFNRTLIAELEADFEFANEQRRIGVPEDKIINAKSRLHAEIQDVGKRWLFDYMSGIEDVEIKANELLLLEQDATRSKAIELLAEWEVKIAIIDAKSDLLADINIDKARAEQKRFSDEISALRSAIRAFRRSLGGALSPERWHDPDIVRRRLPGS